MESFAPAIERVGKMTSGSVTFFSSGAASVVAAASAAIASGVGGGPLASGALSVPGSGAVWFVALVPLSVPGGGADCFIPPDALLLFGFGVFCATAETSSPARPIVRRLKIIFFILIPVRVFA